VLGQEREDAPPHSPIATKDESGPTAHAAEPEPNIFMGHPGADALIVRPGTELMQRMSLAP
jgi:hypothetical protein